MSKKSPSIHDQIAERVMAASVALSEVDDLVREFERAGGRKEMAKHPNWVPFLERLDSLLELDGQFQGLASSLFSGPFAQSEAEHDRAKESSAKKKSRRR
ncbi:MAG: hypothetical protein QM765_36950 [Myxococcales bacterium]